MIDQVTSSQLYSSSGGRLVSTPNSGWQTGRTVLPPQPGSLQLISGLNAVLSAQSELVALASRSGQTGEADSLVYLLTCLLATPDIIPKTPHLLLIRELETPAGGIASPSGELSAAVLVFEYDTPFGGSGFFVGYDPAGRRSVLAPRELRARAAGLAANFWLSRGAHLVRIAFSESHDDSDLLRNPVTGQAPDAETLAAGTALPAVAAELRNNALNLPSAQWAVRETHPPIYLPLLPTLQATLARIGQKTRFNLRYYRRRAEKDLGATFVPDVQIGLNEFLAFNQECGFGVSTPLATLRFRMITTEPNCCIRGVRDSRGRWLAMAGIRRQNGFAELDWQLNHSDLPASSLCTVFRSFLIDYEISIGSTRLYIEGGTSHALQHSFLRQRVTDVVVKRNSLRVRLLDRLASRALSEKSYIRETLLDPGFNWQPW